MSSTTSRPRTFLSSILLLSLLATAPDAGADWRTFRGPSPSGWVEAQEGLPTGLGDEAIAWKTALPGRGLSSPIIVGDRVFLTCSSGPDQNRLHLFAFSAEDGSPIWHREFWATGRTMTHKKTCVAAPTPASDGQRLYALFSSNDLICTDLDGNVQWLRGLTLDYPNASNSLGMASSPVFAGDTLVCQIENDSESFAIGIDPDTGVNRWKIDRPKGANWTSPIVIEHASQEVVALQSREGVVGVIPATGSEVWRYDDGASTIPSSAASGERLFSPSNGLTAFRPTADGGEVEQLWRENAQRPGTASPLVVGDRVFVINGAGVLSCASAESGERLWRLRLEGPFSGSPVASGNHLFIFNEQGLGQCVDVSGEEGVVTGRIELGETVLGTAAISDGAVYVRSDGHLWKLEAP